MKSLRMVLRACKTCSGPLIHDYYEDEFRCLCCGRRSEPIIVPKSFFQVAKGDGDSRHKVNRKRMFGPKY